MTSLVDPGNKYNIQRQDSQAPSFPRAHENKFFTDISIGES